MIGTARINLIKGEKYNWINQKERLIYLGYNFSGNGHWYQFALVESPNDVWCECLASDLISIEETKFPEEVQTEIDRLSQGLNDLWQSQEKTEHSASLSRIARNERNRRKRARKAKR